VREVNKANRRNQGRRGKTDPVDAEATARAVLAGDSTAQLQPLLAGAGRIDGPAAGHPPRRRNAAGAQPPVPAAQGGSRRVPCSYKAPSAPKRLPLRAVTIRSRHRKACTS